MSEPILARDVDPEEITFLWGQRIPRGMISVVAGRPDQGKGLLAVRIAADVSAGNGLSEGIDPERGGRVLYSAAEDSKGGMTRPRLEAAGARLENTLLWRFAMPANQVELHTLLQDCRTLSERQEQAIIDGVPQPNPAYIPDPVPVDLLVIDPFASHLSGGISRHSDNVRNVLGPLTEVIEKTGTAVLIVEHALKTVPSGGDILNVIGGSGSGLPAASRACYVFGQDPDDEDARVLCKAKFNIGLSPLPLRFEVDTEEIDVAGEVPLLIPDRELVAFDPFKMFDKKKPNANPAHRPPDKRAAAAEWLTNYLAQSGEPVLASKIQGDAKSYGMASKTLRRAADDMGIVKSAKGGPNVTWDLPDDVKQLMGLAPAADVESDDAIPDAPPTIPDEAEGMEITDAMLDDFLNGGE